MASTDVRSNAKAKRIRHYREFLSPALHRRFVGAAWIVLAVCFVESAIFRYQSSIFWLLFPFGPAGICTLLLFLSALSIFVLRVAQLHFEARTSKSPAATFLQDFLSLRGAETLAFYIFSAWWFSEVYVWSAGPDLHLVVEGKPHQRPLLNEFPIYLRSHFLLLGISEACRHLLYDEGRIKLPLPGPADAARPFAREPDPFDRVRGTGAYTLWRSTVVAFACAVVNPFIYIALLRPFAWGWSTSVARLFWSVSGSAEPPSIGPFRLWILFRSLLAGVMLLFLWRMSNLAFGVCVGAPPIKGTKPLTEGSKDANGSLLTGLRSKKEAVREFAFWELFYISTRHEGRRKSIYAELDRADGSTWSQMLKSSLAVLEGISARIVEQPGVSNSQNKREHNIRLLPKLSASLKDGQVVTAPRKAVNRTEAVEGYVGDVAKSIGQSSEPTPLQVLWTYVQKSLLSDATSMALGWDNVTKNSKDAGVAALGWRFATFFRETFSKRARMIVLGTPTSDLRPTLLAINSITRLALAAIDEDPYGIVNKDVALILRTFTNTTTQIETCLRDLPVHWSDVGFSDSDGRGRRDGEVDLVLYHLRAALKAIIRGYDRYASDMGLGPIELREARKTAEFSMMCEVES